MSEHVLVVTMAGEPAAIRATSVNTITELADITAVPRAPKHFSGISALRSRALFVIDCEAALLGSPARHDPEGFGVVVIQDGHAYALAVEEVHQLAEIKEGPHGAGIKLSGAWPDLSEGEVITDQGTMMLVDPEKIIAGPEQLADVA